MNDMLIVNRLSPQIKMAPVIRIPPRQMAESRLSQKSKSNGAISTKLIIKRKCQAINNQLQHIPQHLSQTQDKDKTKFHHYLSISESTLHSKICNPRSKQNPVSFEKQPKNLQQQDRKKQILRLEMQQIQNEQKIKFKPLNPQAISKDQEEQKSQSRHKQRQRCYHIHSTNLSHSFSLPQDKFIINLKLIQRQMFLNPKQAYIKLYIFNKLGRNKLLHANSNSKSMHIGKTYHSRDQPEKGNTTLFQALNEFCPDPISNLKTKQKEKIQSSQRIPSHPSQLNLDFLNKNTEFIKKMSSSYHPAISEQRITLLKNRAMQQSVRKELHKTLICTQRKSDQRGKIKIYAFKKTINAFNKTKQRQITSKSVHKDSQTMVKITKMKNPVLPPKNTLFPKKNIKDSQKQQIPPSKTHLKKFPTLQSWNTPQDFAKIQKIAKTAKQQNNNPFYLSDCDITPWNNTDKFTKFQE